MSRYWILGGCACLAAIVTGAFALQRAAEQRSRPKLTVAILSPVPEPGGLIAAEPSRAVSVKLGVMNAGATTLAGLTVKGECSCYFKSTLPPVLEPGEKCELELQLPSPPAGKDVSQIRFFVAGIAEPIQTCAVALLVPAVAQTWLQRVERTSGTAVAGQEHSMEIVLEAIEDSGAEAWVRNIAVEPKELAAAAMRMEERRSTDDDGFLIRTYRVQLCANPNHIGTQTGKINFKDENGAVLAAVQVKLDVISPLIALPGKVELRTDDSQSVARVDVVSRLADNVEVVPVYDAALVDVSPVMDAPGHRLAFEIRPKAKLLAEKLTSVKFAVGKSEPAAVEVRMTP